MVSSRSLQGVIMYGEIDKMRPYVYVVWLPPYRRVASAASSCGFRRIVMWLPPLKIFLVFLCSLTLLVDYFKPYF